MATAPTVMTRGPRCTWQSAPSEAAPPECRVTHASAPKRQASAPSRWAQDALSDRQAYVVSALRPSRRKRGHADDVRVSAQHQCVGDDGGDPSPCSDLTGVEPGTAGSNRRERDDRGLRCEGLPARTKRAATLGVDRHGKTCRMSGRNSAVSSASPPKPPSKSSRNAPHPTISRWGNMCGSCDRKNTDGL